MMKLKESEDFLNSFRRNNDKIEIKGKIYEYINKGANPELCTISRGVTFYIPIFI